jgi:hypothetical protein
MDQVRIAGTHTRNAFHHLVLKHHDRFAITVEVDQVHAKEFFERPLVRRKNIQLRLFALERCVTGGPTTDVNPSGDPSCVMFNHCIFMQTDGRECGHVAAE